MYFPDSLIIPPFHRVTHRLRLPFRWKKRSYALRPTRYGIIFILMLTALLVGSINHNNNFGYLLTFLLGSLVFVSLTHTFTNLQDISITPVPAKPVFAGDTAHISFLLQSPTPHKLGIAGHLDHFSSQPADLVATAATRITILIPTHERGIVRRNSLTLSTYFPLGLMEIQKTLPVSVSCLVYPAPLPGSLVTDSVNGADEDGSVERFDGETDFSELSPYRPGDDLRRVHWKSLAAGKDLQTVKYEQSHAGGTIFSLSSLPGTHIETKLGRLCHMIVTAESRGMNYGLALGDAVIAQAKGIAHKNRCLKALALYR